jgi:hypothetical protein
MDFSKLKLSKEQLDVAIKVAEEAERQGLNPDFVLPMIYYESEFKQSAVSKKGALGVMQLMPKTAKDLKVDPNDMDQNIRGGVSLLKELIANPKIGSDPYKVIAGYNTSTETRDKFYASGDFKDLPKETLDHMINITTTYNGDLPVATLNRTGSTVASAPASSDEVASPYAGANVESDEVVNPYGTSAASADEEEVAKRGSPAETGAMTGVLGLGAGALKWPAFAIGKKALGYLKDKNISPEDLAKVAEISAKQNAAANAATTAAATKQPILVGTTDAGRMGAGQTGNMPYNYAKAAGLTDIEAAQALDMTKNQGGVHDLSGKRTESLQRINQIAPGFVENPNYGGLMTSSGSAGGGPRESFAFRAPEIEDGRVVSQGGMAPVPTSQPVNATPPPPATVAPPLQPKKPNMASRVLGSVAGSPPVMGGLAAYGVGYNAQDAYNRAQDKDYVGATKSGLGALASGATLIPKSAPVAGTASALIDAERRLQNRDYIGGGTSLLGAVAPYAAPFMFGPQVGIPVGVATAVGAPFANEMRDWIMRHTNKPTEGQSADNRSMSQRLADANAEERRRLGYR